MTKEIRNKWINILRFFFCFDRTGKLAYGGISENEKKKMKIIKVYMNDKIDSNQNKKVTYMST